MTMPSIYCSHGHENASDSRFCRLCGERLSSSMPGISDPLFSSQNSQLGRDLRDLKVGHDPHDSNVGKVVGQRYYIQQQLSHGGFGRTYLALDINRFNEPCVLKDFAPQVSDPETLQKAEQLFEREAGVLYQLNHPQIPCFRELLRVDVDTNILDQQEPQTRLFLVQDYVNGKNYHDLLTQRQYQGQCFDETEIIQLFQHVLPVLAYIHGVGVIHRDISPDNLMLRDSDRLPVLIDFGGVKQAAIAVISTLGSHSVLRDHSVLDNHGNSSPLASPSPFITLVGKQGYAPPEQMASGEVRPHSDFYALAVTALVLMTGQSPHHLLDPNSFGYWQTQLSLSPQFARVLRKMLAPYPSDRYPTAQSILTALFNHQASTPNAQSVQSIQREPIRTVPSLEKAREPRNVRETREARSVRETRETEKIKEAGAAGESESSDIKVSGIETQKKKVKAAISQMLNAKRQTFSVDKTTSFYKAREAKEVKDASIFSRLSSSLTTSSNSLKSVLLPLTLVLSIGGISAWVGYTFIPQWLVSRTQSPELSSGGSLDEESLFSATEQRRKAELRDRRDRLSISNQFLVQLTDASFYEQYPRQQGRSLTTGADDRDWRKKWDAIAAQWLDQLDTLLTAEARKQLGSYDQSTRNQWKKVVNSLNVSSRALYDLADLQFFATFPNQKNQDFLNQPIGQIWHGIVFEQLRQLQSGAILEKIEFPPGTYQTTISQILQPGSGYVYLLNAQAAQIMRLNLDNPTLHLSLYVPRPTAEIPFLLDNSSKQVWSGQLPQTGYYEIVVMLDHPAVNQQAPTQPQSFRLTVAVDNVSIR